LVFKTIRKNKKQVFLKHLLVILSLAALLSACGGTSNDAQNTGERNKTQTIETAPSLKTTTPLPDSTLIKNKAANIVRILKAADWRTLATHAHPTLGIRFSPYSDVNENNLTFKTTDLTTIDTTKIYVWGTYDGSGSPIRRTFPQYYREFVYDGDFLEKSTITYNQFKQYGNSYNTIQKTYPDAINVEYYIDNLDPKMRGFDWRVLRFVFTQYEKKWYLTAIIHSSYTS